jgi:hypothetical protein
MPEPAWLVLWATCLALLTALFGGITGAVTWWLGRGVGTTAGLRAVEALASAARTRLSRPVTGFVVGATDGLLLATVLIVLLLAFDPGRALLGSAEFRLVSLLMAGGLGLAAIVLGSLAHVLSWAQESGRYAVGGFAFAFFVVALLTGRAKVGDPILLGLLAGAIVGPLVGLLLRARAAPDRKSRRHANPSDGE